MVLLLVGFAFLAGLVTVLSPCILPVLPVVLSGTVGGRARPWGVITGFVVGFTVLTLTLSSLVQALGFDPDALRWTSAALILLFGVILVVPAWKDAFLQLATRLVSRNATLSQRPRAGYLSGVVLGLGLGAVWTPCVGPIMASVITLALTQSVDASSVLITLAYSVGTALPLLAIMLGGRGLLNRVPWLTKHSSGLQRGFGVLMIVTSVGLFTGVDRSFSTWLLTTFPQYGAGLTAIENQPAVQAELEKTRPARAEDQDVDPLTLGQGTWINSMPQTLEGLRGKVVLVDFWTYSCINCVRTLPYLRSWYEAYRDQGLVIVGVHSPEFAFERSEANLRRAMAELKVTWPVVQDNAFGIWNAFQNQFWPAHYLYDREGRLVETHFGEGNYAETESAIVKALGAASVASRVSQVIPITEGPRTPETYLGYGRGARFASREDVAADLRAQYSAPEALPLDRWALQGPWTIGQEASLSEAGSRLLLHYQGSRVYLVVGKVTEGTVVRVTRNGIFVKTVVVDEDRMYTLLEGEAGGMLELEFSGPAELYAFTFG